MEAIEAGTLIAEKYLLVRQIGRGGMGAVWAARNVRTEREVALKLITDENADYRDRLLREARACGRIAHRNVIEIYDVGETASGAPFLVMPLLEGEPLSRRLRREGAMVPPIAAQIATEIARALSAAHAAGIVHRDLKPANIYLHREPGSDTLVVKVLDFGISKVVTTDSTTTTTGTILGSPAYMSPEQAKGEKYVDHRSDLWSLGVTLFEMLTGKRPFQGESMFTVVAAVLNGPLPHVRDVAPHIDPALADVATFCMQREVQQRVQSADEIAYLLRPFAAGYLPSDLSAFGQSGYHPAASISQMPTAPVVADSASMPPVHFAAAPRGFAPGPPTIASGPPRGSMASISGVGSSSISGMVQAPPGISPEPFSGSTTAAGSMVQMAAPAPQGPHPQPMRVGTQVSKTMLWGIAIAGFLAIAVLAGVIIGLAAGGPDLTASGSTGPSGAALVPGASTVASAMGAGQAANTGTAGAGATAVPSSTGDAPAATSASSGSSASGGGSKTGGTGAKPVATTKPGKPPKGTGVAVPDDPG